MSEDRLSNICPVQSQLILTSRVSTFPGSSVGKESACKVGDPGLIPGLGRSPGGGLGNPLQYSCLKYPMDRGSWWATVHAVTKSQTHLRDWACTHACHCTSPITALLTLNCFCALCVSLLEIKTLIFFISFSKTSYRVSHRVGTYCLLNNILIYIFKI